MKYQHQRGFTLLEMSIVVTIIALIAGVILVADNMIAGARVQGLISQFSQLQASIKSFTTKYGCLPGDCVNAVSYGLGTGGGSGANGNGDGRIGARLDANAHEMVDEWVHLKAAKMLSMDMTTISTNTTVDSTGYALIPLSAIKTPNTASGKYAGWWLMYNDVPYTAFTNANTITSWRGKHFFWITADTRGANNTGAASIRPQEAEAVDKKLDDGLPRLGRVLAINDMQYLTFGPRITSFSYADDVCASGLVSANPSYYGVNATTAQCSLGFLADF